MSNTPTASGDGSERPKKPPLIPWPYLTYEEGKRVAPSLEPQVRALYNYVDAIEVHLTKLEAERDAYKAETEWLCETCNTVFLPSELNSGTMCLICKKCGHTVRPKDKVEIKNLKAERDAARAEVERLREALGWIWSEGADLSTIRLKAKHAFTLTPPSPTQKER